MKDWRVACGTCARAPVRSTMANPIATGSARRNRGVGEGGGQKELNWAEGVGFRIASDFIRHFSIMTSPFDNLELIRRRKGGTRSLRPQIGQIGAACSRLVPSQQACG